MITYLVLNMWNVVVTRTTDLEVAKAAARACKGYLIIRA